MRHVLRSALMRRLLLVLFVAALAAGAICNVILSIQSLVATFVTR
ncbi:hypothetical protein [Aurantimonas sp. HBX-1]|nr:hypothetical protein [Aurantimonas sp. HBX-1]